MGGKSCQQGNPGALAGLSQAGWHWLGSGTAGLLGISCPLLPKVSRIALGLFLVLMVTLITVIMWGPGHATMPSGPSKALSQGLSPQGAVVPDRGGTGQTAMGCLGQCIFYSLLMYNEGPG